MTDTIAARRAELERGFPEWTPRSLGRWLDVCALRYGPREFVVTDHRTFSYREVSDWSRRLADGLVTIGVRPGDHVGMLMANYPEFVALKFAVARAGAVAVPMNFLYQRKELAYVLGQARCRVLITMTGFAGLDYLEMLDDIAPGWDSPGPKTLSSLPELGNVVLLPTDGRTRDGVLTVEGLDGLGSTHTGVSEDRRPAPDSAGDILYTSGTTGKPKGVMVTHDAVQRTAYASALTRAFEDGRRILFSLPCYHMFGYLEGLLAAMTVGGAVILQTRFDPSDFLAGIERHRATDVLCVPTMTVALVQHPELVKYDLSSLRAVLSGSAPGPAWLWERVATDLGATEIVTGYGMTECGGAMTLTLPEDPYTVTASTVGQPKWAGAAGIASRGGALTEYRAVDPVTGDFLPTGETGELVSRGPTTMLGFWAKPDETAAALRDGWVHSGDLGRVGSDGYIQVTGRSKELYKSGGELVMPKEIEELLAGHPGISQVYAIGIPDERWGEAGCACIVRAPGSTVTAAEVIDLCKAQLARFKVPKHVWFLDAGDLPTTPTGKIQKFRLVEQAARQLANDRLEQNA
ncbi:class I adenylate-forming enzyme family protein [Rhodococcus aetherivorans]|uniref:class I adenylate-forming enzyme family protein n=1 Tax=Rhodococcus aetherivorans TaxID=191292 RepID=UPI0002D21F1E|nr:AMP-binding protein [Rhodococcus aetherivorans]CCW13697.1 Long-chain-fatty-acid--CoA ligase [Rhodococcus aetherivorans]